MATRVVFREVGHASKDEPGLRLFGEVPDSDLPGLYSGALACVYPSLYEGFGLPVLEAMAAGAPVVTSNLSSLPEVGGDAVEYADPRDPASISHAMRRLLVSPERRAVIGAAARERAALFDWGRTAETILQVLQRAAS